MSDREELNVGKWIDFFLLLCHIRRLIWKKKYFLLCFLLEVSFGNIIGHRSGDFLDLNITLK